MSRNLCLFLTSRVFRNIVVSIHLKRSLPHAFPFRSKIFQVDREFRTQRILWELSLSRACNYKNWINGSEHENADAGC